MFNISTQGTWPHNPIASRQHSRTLHPEKITHNNSTRLHPFSHDHLPPSNLRLSSGRRSGSRGGEARATAVGGGTVRVAAESGGRGGRRAVGARDKGRWAAGGEREVEGPERGGRGEEPVRVAGLARRRRLARRVRASCRLLLAPRGEQYVRRRAGSRGTRNHTCATASFASRARDARWFVWP